MNAHGNEGPDSDDIRALRRSVGLSQQRLAEMVGCSLATVALFERGYRPHTSTVLPRIIATLTERALNDERPAVTPGARETTSAVAGPTGEVYP
jgi:transcriptional regulator with XRE-family HTH domain